MLIKVNGGDRIQVLETDCKVVELSAQLAVGGLREYFWGGIHGGLMFSGFAFLFSGCM